MKKQIKSVLGKADDFLERQVWSNRSMTEFLLLSVYVYTVLVGIILLWFTSATYFVSLGRGLWFGVGMLAYNFGYLLSNCHQMPERSVIFWGIQYPFCSRDLGIYLGCLLGGIAPLTRLKKISHRLSPTILFMFLAPLAIDGISQTILTARESNNTLRILTGVLFGFGLVFFLAEKILSHMSQKDRVKYAFHALKLGALFAIAILLGGYALSGKYVSMDEAVSASGLNPTFVTYIPQRSFQMIRHDPYLGTYDDMVLDAVYRHGYRGHGGWIVYEGEMEYIGKYVYFSKGNGTLKIISDVSNI
jgi:uncharacterized membrane protein